MAAPETGFNPVLDQWASVDGAGYAQFIAWAFTYGRDNGLADEVIRVVLELNHTRTGFEEAVGVLVRAGRRM